MNPRATCSSCGRKGADGEPPLCGPCFIEEFRHDPACAMSVYAMYYCGGAEGGCAKCRREDAR